MPLRITLELIPRGDEAKKRKLAVVDIENDCTAGDMRGGGAVGNYRVCAAGLLAEAGWDDFADFIIGPLKRGDYMDTAIEVFSVLHSSRMAGGRFPRRVNAAQQTKNKNTEIFMLDQDNTQEGATQAVAQNYDATRFPVTEDKWRDVERRFTYHQPKASQPERYVALRAKGKELAELILQCVHDSREQALALTKVEEAIFWANAGIARNE